MKIQACLTLVATLFALSGCGGAGGEPVASGIGVAPIISAFVISPSTVELNDNGGQVDVFGTFDFSEPDGNLSTVTLIVLDAAGNTLITEVESIPGAGGVTSGTIEGSVALSTTAITDFTLRVFLTDLAGLQSNVLEALFRVRPITWATKTPMPSPRLEFATAAVNDLIYVIGGRDDTAPVTPRTPVAIVEIYDPSSDSWSAGPSLPAATARPNAATVGGKIYVIGGVSEFGIAVNSVYEFDPATQLWTTKTSLPTARSASAVAVHGGLIYVAGGSDGGMQSNALLWFDPAADLWSAGSPMSHAREGAAGATIDGKILVYGGRTGTYVLDAGYRRVLESYDPVMDLWTERAPGEPRRDMGAAVINGVMYTFGGNNVARGLDTVRGYDNASDTWTGNTQLPILISYAQAEAIGDRIYVFSTTDTFEYSP